MEQRNELPGDRVPRRIKDWDAKYREDPDELLFGREASELARLTYSFWKLVRGDRRSEPRRALDLGCGEGRDAVFFARKGFRVTAVDGAEAALAKAERLAEQEGATDLDFCRMDILDFPIDPHYDVLLAHNSLQFLGDHCLPTLRTLQEATPLGGFNAVSVFTREAEALAGATDLYRFDHNELKFRYEGWRLLFYSEDTLWRDPAKTYLTFARIIAVKE